MLTGPMTSTRGWRSVARTTAPDMPPLHRLTPTAVTRERRVSSEDDDDSDSCGLDCYSVAACCGCCAGARHCCTGTCRNCLVAVRAHSWYWKALLLFLLLLTTSQLYVNMTFYKISRPLFSINTTIAGSENKARTFKEQRQHENQSWRREANRAPVQDDLVGLVPAGLFSSKINISDSISKRKNSSDSLRGRIEQPNALDVRNSLQSAQPSEPSGDGAQQRQVAASKNMTNMTTSIKHKSLLSDELPQCPPVPPDLLGHVLPVTTDVDIAMEERLHPELSPGGRWSPPSCQSRHRVAVIIPYRAREAHLAMLLRHLHPFLQRQQLDYTILVVEQAGRGKFNRAMLLNIGALEAVKLYPFQCFVFHDIDLLPEDDRNLYTCPQQPRHMSVAINVMGYKLPYNDIFGGVSALTVDHFRKVNGFSNKFWGWGGEDDDMSNRIKFHGLYISRYPASIARYFMLKHQKEKPNPQRYQYLYDGKRRFLSDGLNSAKYRVLDVQLRKLYTWLYVEPMQS